MQQIRKLLIIFVLGICFGLPIKAQFKYYGFGIQSLGMSNNFSEVGFSFQFFNQFRYNGGWGFEAGYNLLTRARIEFHSGYENSFNPDPDWRRQGGAFIGGRYRFFLGNHLFAGFGLRLALYRELFLMDREHGYSEVYEQPIPAEYANYNKLGFILRGSSEFGVIANLGKRMYFSFAIDFALQRNFLGIDTFGSFVAGPSLALPPYFVENVSEKTYSPFKGLSAGWGISMALGFKH